MKEKRKRAVKNPKNPRRSKWDQYLTLDWKEFYLILITWILFLVLHVIANIILGFDEGLFLFFFKYIVPLFFLIALIYTLFKKIRK